MLSGFPSQQSNAEPPQYPTTLDGVTIEYFESGCYGTCPSFSLRITKAFANWEGYAHVRVKGKRKARITEQQFETLLRAWYDGKFFAMRENYCNAVCPNGTALTSSDLPESSINLDTPEFNKGTYQCYASVDHKPLTPKPPDQYFDLVKQMRAFAKQKKWLR